MSRTAATPAPGQQAAGDRLLVVSLHDVHADSWRTYRPWIDELAGLGVPATSLLVVPRWRGRPLAAGAGLTAWLGGLAAAGHEVVQHGLVHAAGEIRGGLYPQLMGRFYTAGEGEFYQLGYVEARTRLVAGRRLLAEAGLTAPGFVAPAWLLSGLARRALVDLGFRYTTYVHALELLPGGPRTWAPSVTLSLRSAWRKSVSLRYAPAWQAAVGRARLLRLAVHPTDVADRDGRALLRRLVTDALRDRRPATYAGWLDGEEAASAPGRPAAQDGDAAAA